MNEVTAKYLKTRDVYLENAKEAIKKRELMKASELLWGGVTQEIKALASTQGIAIRKHHDFFEYTQAISKEQKDEEYYKLFVELNALHKNFYDEVIPPESFPIFYEKTITFLEKLKKLLKKANIE